MLRAARERWQKHGKYAIELMRMWHRLQQSTALSGSAETYQREVQRPEREMETGRYLMPCCSFPIARYQLVVATSAQVALWSATKHLATDKKSRASRAGVEGLKREQREARGEEMGMWFWSER